MGKLLSRARSGLKNFTATSRGRLRTLQVRAAATHPVWPWAEPAAEPRSNALRLAVLLDAENVSLSEDRWEWLHKRLSPFGTVTVKRAYGRWDGKAKGKQNHLYHDGFRLMHHASMAAGKNAADIAMAVDAMQVMHAGMVDGFCLVSGDSDFTPLVAVLREAGMMVFGCGHQKASTILERACHAYWRLPSSEAKTGNDTGVMVAASTTSSMGKSEATQAVVAKKAAKKTPAKKATKKATAKKVAKKAPAKKAAKKTVAGKLAQKSSSPASGKNKDKLQTSSAKKGTAKPDTTASAIPQQNPSPEHQKPRPNSWAINYSNASDADLVAFLGRAISVVAKKKANGSQHDGWVHLSAVASVLLEKKVQVTKFTRHGKSGRGLNALFKTMPKSFQTQDSPGQLKGLCVRCAPLTTSEGSKASHRIDLREDQPTSQAGPST